MPVFVWVVGAGVLVHQQWGVRGVLVLMAAEVLGLCVRGGFEIWKTTRG